MSTTEIKNLEPKEIWSNFASINAIPRASKKEERIIRFMLDFGKKLNLETKVDAIGNVLIKKPATPGMEDRKKVVLQSHLDMVHQKNDDTDFDFESEGIRMLVEGDWVEADGTTLGADNGIGVAAIMGVLQSSNLEHPAIEALFTIDEETGMTGAQELQPGYLSGEILLNLDTEEDDEIDIGCAGGIDITAERTYEAITPRADSQGFMISVTGLQGGHSGMDIHKGFGNANKIMNELLLNLKPYLQLGNLKGGSLRNAIPRESFAHVMARNERIENLQKDFEETASDIKAGLASIEPDLKLELSKADSLNKVLNDADLSDLLESIDRARNGVFKMNPEIPELVEASNNIAKVAVADGLMKVECLTRSSVEESKTELMELMRSDFENFGYRVSFSGSYPGWSPNPNSPILGVLTEIYERLYSNKPKVIACHAGLECGIIGSHYPEMDMISFGPTIERAHSPDERVSISSVSRFWKFLIEILKNIPVKD